MGGQSGHKLNFTQDVVQNTQDVVQNTQDVVQNINFCAHFKSGQNPEKVGFWPFFSPKISMKNSKAQKKVGIARFSKTKVGRKLQLFYHSQMDKFLCIEFFNVLIKMKFVSFL